MFKFKTKGEPDELDEAIKIALQQLADQYAYTEQYAEIMKHVETLHELKAKHRRQRVSPDTVVIVLANLFGLIMIIKHEEVNVIATKALSLVIKPKI